MLDEVKEEEEQLKRDKQQFLREVKFLKRSQPMMPSNMFEEMPGEEEKEPYPGGRMEEF